MLFFIKLAHGGILVQAKRNEQVHVKSNLFSQLIRAVLSFANQTRKTG